MLKQATDFFNESILLYELLKDLSDRELNTHTQFKMWTFNDIIRHLHVWNNAITLSLINNNEWQTLEKKVKYAMKNGKSLNQFEKEEYSELYGKKLLLIWKKSCYETKEVYKTQNPKNRIKWFGPDMSIISAISSRHMETWAHGQSIYDLLGVVRKNNDSILNIVIMGNNTFKWSFRVNNLSLPEEPPYLSLAAPSGKIWNFNRPSNINKIEGLAEDFCKVVTQVRNIRDLELKVKGAIAKKWMKIAQCFAGKAEKPPKAGSRRVITSLK